MKLSVIPSIILLFLVSPGLSQPGTVIQSFSSPTQHLSDLTWDGNYLYLLGLADHNIYQIDPNNGNVLSTVSTGISGALGLTYKNGHFWVSVVADNTLKKLAPDGSIIKSVSIPTAQCIGIEWDGATFRVADSGSPDEKIIQVDSLGNLISSFLFPGDSPFGLTWDGNTIWCADNQMGGGAAPIYQFDPGDGSIITSFYCPNSGRAVNGLAWDGQYLWLADQTNDMIYQVEGNPLQQYGAVSGYITDWLTGWGVGAVSVLSAQTDTSGYYLADSLSPGFYNITLVVAGFDSVTIDSLQIVAGDTAALDLALHPVGEHFDIGLRETDGEEWMLHCYRDTTWRFYEIPLGRCRGNGMNFLDTPIEQFIIYPIGGGGPVTQMEVADWIDAIVLADTLIDNFDDGDISDWLIDIALNGSYLETGFDPATPDGSPLALQLRHGNTMGQSFAGYMANTSYTPFMATAGDTLSFWLKGTPPYPVVGVSDRAASIPDKFVLKQNYPNPFNPATHIGFRLPVTQAGISEFGIVHLTVFDLLGREVKTLISEKLTPGNYTVQWAGRDNSGKAVSSGVYIYQLKTGRTVLRKKMVLMR